MKYKIIKIIPIILFALLIGIPYIIYEPFSSLAILISMILTLLLINWYEHFDKKDKAQTDLLYYAGEETHNALVKDTEQRTVKQIIKYLKERGYTVTKN